MHLVSYLTFEEYQALGGKCTQDAFLTLQFDTESKMDYITSGRLAKLIEELGTVPKEVQMLEVKLVNIENNSKMERDDNTTSYSNGIESFGYGDTSNKSLDASLTERFKDIMMEYLYPKYPELFYRGRWVNRARYNNPSQST
jgi:hypothetical protein